MVVEHPVFGVAFFHSRSLNMLASFLAGCGLFAVAASHPAGHSNGLQRRAIDLDAFRLTATSQYVNATVAGPSASLQRIKRADYLETATELVKSVAKGATYRVVGDHYVGSNGIAHVNFKQTANGLDIDNADFNINVSNTPIDLVNTADRR
jgi:extracellular elastinolytic metalloproteinase